MKRKLIKLATLGLTAAFVVGAMPSCGYMGAIETKEGELTIKFYDGAYKQEWLEKAAKDFVAKKKDEGVTVSYKLIPDVNIDSNVASEIGTTTGVADIYMLNSGSSWVSWMTSGYLEDLTSVYNTEVETSEGKRTVKEYLADGYDIQYYARPDPLSGKFSPWAMPWGSSTISLVYNEDILLATEHTTTVEGKWVSGENWDAPPETVEELLAYCKDLSADDKTPFVFPGADHHWFKYLLQVWWAQYQGVEEENTLNVSEGDGAFYDFYNMHSANVLKQKGIQAAIDTMQEIFLDMEGKVNDKGYHNWQYSMKDVDSYDIKTATKHFGQGEAAMMIGASFMYNEIKDYLKGPTANTKFKMMSLPTLDGALEDEDGNVQKINYYTSEDMMIVPSAAVNKSLAKEFLAFLCNETYLLDFVKKTGTLRPFEYAHDKLDAQALGLNTFNASVLDVYKQSDVHLVALPANIENYEDRSRISLYESMGMSGKVEWGTFFQNIRKQDNAATIMDSVYSQTKTSFDKWLDRYYPDGI